MFFKLWNFEQRRGGNPGVKNSRQIKYMEQAEDFTYYTIYLAFHQHQHLHTFSHAKDEKLQKKNLWNRKNHVFQKIYDFIHKKSILCERPNDKKFIKIFKLLEVF